jgi:L-fuconolactonase
MGAIDSHQHFWKFDPVRDAWIDDRMKAIQRDFMPADLNPVLLQHGFDGSVVVQSDQSPEENLFHLRHAKDHDFIKGIVGWVDFRAKDIDEQLSLLNQHDKLKGFRHVLQGEPQRDYMLRPDFMRGIRSLHNFGYTYDILIYPDQLTYTSTFVEAFPYQPFVIDHLAKPHIRDRKIEPWKKEILSLARYENVWCKISGMVTEANWANWKKEDFRPYLDAVLEAFGSKRVMFGSDWPVCLVAASYDAVVDIVKEYSSALSASEQAALWGGNARNFYSL